MSYKIPLMYSSFTFVCSLIFQFTGAEICKFPEYMQNDPTNPTDMWYTNEMKGSSYHSVLFYGGFMQATAKEFSNVTVYGYNLLSFNRSCVQTHGDKYIVAQNDTTYNSTYYVCMQFIVRNRGVVQIKSGDMAQVPHLSLCDESSLVLNEWPLLLASFRRYRIPCPVELTGNYYFSIYDPQTDQMNCQGHWLRPRLQAGCMVDEGFRFRFPQCAGYPLTKVENLQCFASWTSDDQIYIIAARVDADREPPPWTEWCLRFPKNFKSTGSAILENSKTSYIFLDMKCDTSPEPSPKSIRHYRLTFWPAETGFCADETDTCESLKPLGYCDQKLQQLSCLKTCGICNKREVFTPPCEFAPELQGSWLIPGTDQEIIIANSTFHHPKHQSSFQCVSLYRKTLQVSSPQNGEYGEDEKNLYTYIVYSKFVVPSQNTECKPRFTCLQFAKPTYNSNNTKAVLGGRKSLSQMGYRIGQSFDTLPIVEEVVCDEDSFVDDYPPYSNRYRNKEMKVVLDSSGIHTPIPCHIDGQYELSMVQSITTSRFNKEYCRYILDDCLDNSILNMADKAECSNFQSILTSHTCLLSSVPSIPSLKRILLTQNSDGHIYCWFIENMNPENERLRIILTDDTECNAHSYALFLKFGFDIVKPAFIFELIQTAKCGSPIQSQMLEYINGTTASTKNVERFAKSKEQKIKDKSSNIYKDEYSQLVEPSSSIKAWGSEYPNYNLEISESKNFNNYSLAPSKWGDLRLQSYSSLNEDTFGNDAQADLSPEFPINAQTFTQIERLNQRQPTRLPTNRDQVRKNVNGDRPEDPNYKKPPNERKSIFNARTFEESESDYRNDESAKNYGNLENLEEQNSKSVIVQQLNDNVQIVRSPNDKQEQNPQTGKALLDDIPLDISFGDEPLPDKPFEEILPEEPLIIEGDKINDNDMELESPSRSKPNRGFLERLRKLDQRNPTTVNGEESYYKQKLNFERAPFSYGSRWRPNLQRYNRGPNQFIQSKNNLYEDYEYKTGFNDNNYYNNLTNDNSYNYLYKLNRATSRPVKTFPLLIGSKTTNRFRDEKTMRPIKRTYVTPRDPVFLRSNPKSLIRGFLSNTNDITSTHPLLEYLEDGQKHMPTIKYNPVPIVHHQLPNVKSSEMVQKENIVAKTINNDDSLVTQVQNFTKLLEEIRNYRNFYRDSDVTTLSTTKSYDMDIRALSINDLHTNEPTIIFTTNSPPSYTQTSSWSSNSKLKSTYINFSFNNTTTSTNTPTNTSFSFENVTAIRKSHESKSNKAVTSTVNSKLYETQRVKNVTFKSSLATRPTISTLYRKHSIKTTTRSWPFITTMSNRQNGNDITNKKYYMPKFKLPTRPPPPVTKAENMEPTTAPIMDIIFAKPPNYFLNSSGSVPNFTLFSFGVINTLISLFLFLTIF